MFQKDKYSSYNTRLYVIYYTSLFFLTNVIMKTLKLFNAVVSKESKETPFISDQGFVIESNAIWAKDQIISYYQQERLSGNDLNKTFHKSWAKIKNSSRLDLLIDQIHHYISTYGSDFKSDIYIPDEILDVPLDLSYKVIKAYTKDQMIDKCMLLLNSGIALKEETINDLLTILVDELSYVFTGNENIKNKEAVIKIADLYGILPTNTMEFFRYIVYRSTGQSLLIKNNEVISDIKASNFNPSAQFNKFGLIELSEIFNRFKPLFLAFKNNCPKTINKIAKLSKKHHKPLVVNPLNNATNSLISKEDLHWLDNATPYALFKALSACYARANGQSDFLYRVRNGKSFAKEKNTQNSKVSHINLQLLEDYIKNRFNLSETNIYLPKNVKYALPTSEKMFVGNVPTGTRFYGDKMAVGIYWENDFGARDLDLSSLNIGGKIGWNSSYNQNEGSLMFSGDITDAPNGAVEYLYANKGLSEPTLVLNNVYSGQSDCDYKIIVGKGDKIDRDYMMNPNKLFVDIKCKSVQKETVLGIFIPKKNKQCFVLLNFGSGHARVSGYSEITNIATKALYQQWSKPYSFNKLVKSLGANIVDDPKLSHYDFSLDNLEKDSFVKLFK